MAYLTASEIEHRYCETMGLNLGPVFYSLFNELAWLNIKWRQYTQLFSTSSSRLELINSTASFFFYMVEIVVWEDVLLHIAKLTDKEKSCGHDNLSICHLHKLLDDAELTAKSINLIDIARDKSAFARDWRNRKIAHFDLKLMTTEQSAIPLEPAGRNNIDKALDAIAAVLNTIELHYCKCTTGFDFHFKKGDAESLLFILRDGLEAQTTRLRRLNDGKPIESDLDNRGI